jgi:uncharacterized protein
VKIILWILTVYAVICVVAYFGNRRYMYFPDPARTAHTEAGLNSIEEVEIATADGVTLVAWHAPAKADKPTILYFHGNGANAANRASKIHTILESGFGVFYLNNRGYGGSGGEPTEENNVADAIAAYDQLAKLGPQPTESSPMASLWALARRCDWQRREQSPQLCWRRHLPRQLMWRGPPISGCRSTC